MDNIKATFVRFKPRLSGEPIHTIVDKDLVDEILKHPDLEDFKTSLSGDIFLEVPSELADLNISQKLKSMLDEHKGTVIRISP
jgi:hypothetical protein